MQVCSSLRWAVIRNFGVFANKVLQAKSSRQVAQRVDKLRRRRFFFKISLPSPCT